MDNDNNNSYYKYETPNNETPELFEPNINEKFKNITNISQLFNHYIKQLKPNEFSIRCRTDLVFFFSISTLIGIAVFSVLIWVLNKFENIDVGFIMVIIFIVVFGGVACFSCYGLLTFEIRQKVILAEDYIQIKTFYILCCLNKNEILNYMNLKSFQVEKKKLCLMMGNMIIII